MMLFLPSTGQKKAEKKASENQITQGKINSRHPSSKKKVEKRQPKKDE